MNELLNQAVGPIIAIFLQTSALLAGLLFFAPAFATGYLAGGPEPLNRRALGIMTFARNGRISMLIAGQVFAQDPQVLVMATIMTACSVVLGVLIVTSIQRLQYCSAKSSRYTRGAVPALARLRSTIALWAHLLADGLTTGG